MTGSYSVIVAPSARAHAQRIDEWWRENRPKAPDLFARELDAAFVRIAAAPMAVAVYRETKGRAIRRLLMPRTSYHVFFEVNERQEKVHVLAVWHAARGRAPRL
jgi:plasmid stabilization system protein ParE